MYYKGPTTKQIEIVWPYTQIKKLHNEEILVVLPYMTAMSEDFEMVFHCRITCCFPCITLLIQIRQGKSPLVQLISGILNPFQCFGISLFYFPLR